MAARTAPPESDAAERLRGAGLRVTAPRVAVLAHLGRERRHPTAEQIHGSLRHAHPSLSLSTVYGILDAFVRAGLCRRLFGGDGLRRVDGTLQDHDHAVCRGCGRIFDVDRGRRTIPRPPGRLPRGLRVTGVRFEYDVICPACLPGAERSGEARETPRAAAAARGPRPTSSEKEATRWRSSRAPRRTRT